MHGMDHIRLDKNFFLVLIFVHFFPNINNVHKLPGLVGAVGPSCGRQRSRHRLSQLLGENLFGGGFGCDGFICDLFLWIILWCAWVRLVVYLVMVTQVVGTSIIVEKKDMISDNSTNNMSELSPLVETTTTGVSGFAESRWVRAAWRSRARQPGRVAPELGSEASGNRNCMFR